MKAKDYRYDVQMQNDNRMKVVAAKVVWAIIIGIILIIIGLSM